MFSLIRASSPSSYPDSIGCVSSVVVLVAIEWESCWVLRFCDGDVFGIIVLIYVAWEWNNNRFVICWRASDCRVCYGNGIIFGSATSYVENWLCTSGFMYLPGVSVWFSYVYIFYNTYRKIVSITLITIKFTVLLPTNIYSHFSSFLLIPWQ